MNNKRIKSAQALLSRKGVSAFLVTNLKNIRYLTGFTGSSALLLLLKRQSFLITDFRYQEQAEEEVEGADILISKTSPLKEVKTLLGDRRIRRIGFEESASFLLFKKLSRHFTAIPIRDLVEELRVVKDDRELGFIREAVRRAERAFRKVKPYIRVGKTEMEIARRLEEAVRMEGAKTLPFPVIVASGERSSLPHASPSERRLRHGDLLIIDWGAEAGGYYSDMTRTFIVGGSVSAEKRRVYRTVHEALKRAKKAIKQGVKAYMVDAAARDHIRAHGYGRQFGHGTGHGVGLDIHEAPRISWIGKETLRKGMVFTVEPGVYIPGMGGVRIEDMVTITSSGVETLTSLSRRLEIIK